MPTVSQAILSDLILQAAAEPFGILIETDNVPTMQTHLQTARKTVDAHVIIRVPGIPNTLFIMPESVELE